MTPEPTKKRKKGFDCVAFQREQRARISRMLNAMTKEEQLDWLCNVEITDPILRRIMEEAPRGTLRRANTRAEGSLPSRPKE